MDYIERTIEKTIRKYLGIFSSVAITGPRQSGKSTMLKERFVPEYRYVTFDNPLEIEHLESDPNGFIKKYNNKVIFDEIQKAPELFNYLKIEIDNDRDNYGKFIITGSSQFSIIHNITETLAGRIGSLSLLPFQCSEIPEGLREKQVLFGSYPEIVKRCYKDHSDWYGAYIYNYIERDVRSLANIGNLRDFQRLISLLAARCAQELNMSELASDIGVSVKTVRSWISILEASYIIFLPGPYYKNLGKRIVKRPKIYFFDTGIVCYLTGTSSKELLEKGPMAGPVFENYVISEVKKSILHNGSNADIFYFRSNLGLEVDLIVLNRDTQELLFTEIKNTHTARIRMIDPLRKIIDLEKKSEHLTPLTITGTLVYRDHKRVMLSEEIEALGMEDFLDGFAADN